MFFLSWGLDGPGTGTGAGVAVDAGAGTGTIQTPTEKKHCQKPDNRGVQ